MSVRFDIVWSAPQTSLYFPRRPRRQSFRLLSAMTSVAGRKKSVVGANGTPSIDIPQQNLLNKSASQSTSLYQQCSQLRARLMSIRGFQPFLDLAIPHDDSRKSTDMVHDLWGHLELGVPLVFLFNLLPPPATQIENINTDPSSIDIGSMSRMDPIARKKSKQRTIAQVVMAITRLQKEGHWDHDLNFTIGELQDNNTNGFVKVRSPCPVKSSVYRHDRSSRRSPTWLTVYRPMSSQSTRFHILHPLIPPKPPSTPHQPATMTFPKRLSVGISSVRCWRRSASMCRTWRSCRFAWWFFLLNI